MACNKDEAVRAKGIAENLLLERDIFGAKKLALKAHSLFPELDGLTQFLEIIDVYVAHEKKINGVSDYYGMFGVDPFSDEEIIKKQYKRMALFLHPDKNKSVGAAGAFQIISEAWGVLRAKDKRSEYDLKVNIRSSSQTARFSPSIIQQSPPFSNSNGQVHEFQNNAHPAFPAQSIHTPSPPFSNLNGLSRNPMTSSSSFFRPDTFWTLCNRCYVQYEYTNLFLNQTVLCYRCHQPFLATAIPDPPVQSRSSRPRPFPNQQPQDMHAAAQPSASRTSQAPSSHTSKKPAKRRHEIPINMERENDPPSVPEIVETASASYTASPGLNKERPVKRRRKDGQKCDDHNEGSQGIAGSGVYTKKASADAKGKFVAEQPRSTRKLSQRNIRAILIGKAKTEIRHQLNQWEKEKVTSSLSNGQDMGNVVNASCNNSRIYPETKDEPKLEPLKSSTFKVTVVQAKPDDDNGSPSPSHFPCVSHFKTHPKIIV